MASEASGRSSDSRPDSSSDGEAEPGSSANAYVVCPNLATLGRLNNEPVIAEDHWHDEDETGFHRRAIVGRYRFPTDGREVPRVFSQLPSQTSSMAVSVSSRSTTGESSARSVQASSTSAPSFGFYSTLNSSSSARTKDADVVVQTHVLEEDEDGVPRAPTPEGAEGRLACCFSFLACSFRSDSVKEWDTHSQSHFRGRLPLSVYCPFRRCAWKSTAGTGEEAWHDRRTHIIGEHRGNGVVEVDRRPPSSLIQHLWREQIIDNAQLKELREYGRLTESQVFTRSAGESHNRRDERRSRAVARA